MESDVVSCEHDNDGGQWWYLYYSKTHAKVCKPRWINCSGMMVCYTRMLGREMCRGEKELFGDWKLVGKIEL